MSTLDYILKHPTEVGFQCKAEPGLLQIESIDLLSLQPISQDLPPVNKQFVMNCYPLYKILELATVRVFGVTVQADEVLHNLMSLLSKFGSLRELTIKNINNVSLLSRLESIFQRHRYLSKLSLAALPRIAKEVIPRDTTVGERRITHFYSQSVSLNPIIFTLLAELQELTLGHIYFTDQLNNSKITEAIFECLPMLALFELTDPKLDDKQVGIIQAFSRNRRSNNGKGFKVKIGQSISSHQIQETGPGGYHKGSDTKIFCQAKLAAQKAWDPDNEFETR